MAINKQNHKNGRKFFNPTIISDGEKSFFKGLTMWLGTKKATWPKYVANQATPNLNHAIQNNQIAITFVNHVTFLMQFPGLTILTDPMWSKRASPLSWLGPQRVRDPGIALEDLPKIDVILISHNHYDHLDLETLKYLDKKYAPQIYIPIGDTRVLKQLKNSRISEMDWWDKKQLKDNIKINFTPMQHWSARGPFDQYDSLWGSFVIEYNDKKIFFGGDGGYCEHFKTIQNEFGNFDLTFVGIGAYEPRWFMKNMHTNPEEAVLIHFDLQSKQTIGMHFGTFQLSAESLEQPRIDLQAAKIKHNVSDLAFDTMLEGETRIFSL